MMARRDRFGAPPAWIGHVIALCVLAAVAGAYLLAAWLDCRHPAAGAVCLLPAGITTAAPGDHRRRLRCRWLAWRVRLGRWAVRCAQAAQPRLARWQIDQENRVLHLQRAFEEAQR